MLAYEVTDISIFTSWMKDPGLNVCQNICYQNEGKRNRDILLGKTPDFN
jgi:hypothetical protein